VTREHQKVVVREPAVLGAVHQVLDAQPIRARVGREMRECARGVEERALAIADILGGGQLAYSIGDGVDDAIGLRVPVAVDGDGGGGGRSSHWKLGAQ
jgi:hypothetical protein